MPTSLSQRRGAKTPRGPPPAAPSRAVWPRLALIAAAALLAVVVAALPASLIARFLPPGVGAEDFSGTISHGSRGRGHRGRPPARRGGVAPASARVATSAYGRRPALGRGWIGARRRRRCGSRRARS